MITSKSQKVVDCKEKNKYRAKKYLFISILVLFLLWFTYSFMFTRSEGKRVQCYARVYQYALALRNYSDYYGSYPQYYSVDGTPLWSWRFIVEQPPYIGLDFRKDEIWNSEHNLPLVKRIDTDKHHICPGSSSKDNLATYVAVTGPGTVWTEYNNGRLKKPRSYYSEMIIAIETTESKCRWAEPGDDVSPEDVIRLFQADPGLVKNSKFWPIIKCHWPKYYISTDGGVHQFSEIKNIEELKRRLILSSDIIDE